MTGISSDSISSPTRAAGWLMAANNSSAVRGSTVSWQARTN